MHISTGGGLRQNSSMDNSDSSATMRDHRLEQAKSWIQTLGIDLRASPQSVAGDASFRRYFRIDTAGRSLILMDAPPPGEDVRPFINVSHRLRLADLHAPEILHSDQENGFLLLEDLGDDMYRDLVDVSNANEHFPDLFVVLQTLALQTDARDLPVYDEGKLRAELNLLPDWYLGKHRKQMRREPFERIWDDFCDLIIASAIEQPQSFVHRDFHSSNLLRTPDETVGIIDFQDAVMGPVSYDFISLVWDRHITWPRGQIENWMEEIRQMLGLDMKPARWQRYCDLMGLQRNLKIVGIFARLYYRDGKKGYIEMIPRFYDYVTSTLRHYPEFSEILTVLEQKQCVP